MCPEQIRSVVDMPVHKNTTSIKGFLGAAGFYRRWVADYAKITNVIIVANPILKAITAIAKLSNSINPVLWKVDNIAHLFPTVILTLESSPLSL